MIKSKFVGFANCLQEDDYGIILSAEGKIKGIWIPQDLENDSIPVAIAEICIANFGIDPNNDDLVSQTVH